jgi:hypothetical protein
LVSELAEGLQTRGYLVSNLEMPWSGRRHYDVDVAHAQREVEAVILSLNLEHSVLAAKVPILWTVAKNDYPALRSGCVLNQRIYSSV